MTSLLLFFCVDGLQGFAEAIEAVYPQAMVQLCIVHLVRVNHFEILWPERMAQAERR